VTGKLQMRVLMLVSSPFITDPRIYNEAQTLIKAGYSVTVLAWDREKNAQVQQDMDGIEIFRLRIPVPFKYGIAKVPWHALHLAAWQCEAYCTALRLNKQRPFSFIHCYFLDTLPLGIALKRKWKAPLVFDVRDIYGNMLQSTLPAPLARLFFSLEKKLLKYVDSVITVSEIMSKYFEDSAGRTTTIIMNCKRLVSSEYQPPANSKFTLLYIGTLHKIRSMDLLFSVAAGLPDVDCIIGGIGQPGYISMLQEQARKSNNISFVGRVPFAEVLKITQTSDAVFCMLDPGDINGKIGMPNKLFEAMACGRLIICTKGTYSGDFVEREGTGLAVDYSEAALKEAIVSLRDNRELRENLGRNALRAAVTRYNWTNEEKKLLEIYAGLQDRSKGR